MCNSWDVQRKNLKLKGILLSSWTKWTSSTLSTSHFVFIDALYVHLTKIVQNKAAIHHKRKVINVDVLCPLQCPKSCRQPTKRTFNYILHTANVQAKALFLSCAPTIGVLLHEVCIASKDMQDPPARTQEWNHHHQWHALDMEVYSHLSASCSNLNLQRFWHQSCTLPGHSTTTSMKRYL